MKAAVVSSGDIKDYGYLKGILSECTMIVCADGGAAHVNRCGMTPDAVVGDLDSIDSKTYEGLKNSCIIEKYPREKDYTDTQLAIEYAIRNGADDILLLGCTGERLDHTLANILLLIHLLKRNVNACLINEKNTIFAVKDHIVIGGNPGDLLSLVPVIEDAKGIFTSGLKYALVDGIIQAGEPLGISNVFVEKQAEIRLSSGYLLIIKSRD